MFCKAANMTTRMISLSYSYMNEQWRQGKETFEIINRIWLVSNICLSLHLKTYHWPKAHLPLRRYKYFQHWDLQMHLFQPPSSGETPKLEPFGPLELPPIPSAGAHKATIRQGTCSITAGILILSYSAQKINISKCIWSKFCKRKQPTFKIHVCLHIFRYPHW